jgi:SAM-dependent methyltransferase
VVNVDAAHTSALEQERTADLMQLIPRGYHSVLDAGTREGFFSLRLAEFFDRVTALDLHKPDIQHERITCVQGDLTKLSFPDNSFDVVFCCEVLEHIPAVEQAVSEIKRVARHAILIGVPYKQDIRVARATCATCGKVSPPWGHVNVFDEQRLESLFRPFRVVKQSTAGTDYDRTSALAAWFTDLGKNPYGAYGPGQWCMHCQASLEFPPARSFVHKICGAIGVRLMKAHSALTSPHANWIHTVFER